MKQHIRLKGLTGEFEGRTYESDALLKAGRLASLDIVLDDSSVSRQHAEVRATDNGWFVRDLKSTNGTFVNGVRLAANEERPLQDRDVIQFGKIALQVETLTDQGKDDDSHSSGNLRVEATSNASWDDAFNSLAYDRNRCLRPGEQLLAMLRAGRNLVHIDNEDELLHSILNDAVSVLDAQRGAIVLAEGSANDLQLRALASGRGDPAGRFHFSKNLAQRSFQRGESILWSSAGDDPELAYQSIAEGAMASVLCVVLRTPRRRLGVLHLDRSHWQKAFTEDDLHVADALAANVSAGIESAQLFRQQRDLFLNTITILAQAVELRDPYTGGHTAA